MLKTDNECLEFINYCLKNGIDNENILNLNNRDNFAKTISNAFNGYPVIEYSFNGRYKEKTFHRMLKIDFKSRIGKTIGIASKNFESTLLIEKSTAKKTGSFQYLKAIDLKSFYLLFKPATLRQNAFEKYAFKKRKKYIDDNTWYIYIFATKKEFQRQGYGKSLMNLVISFAKEYKYNICLETDLKDNIKIYENFGFRLVDSSIYKNCIEHFVFYYKYNKDEIENEKGFDT